LHAVEGDIDVLFDELHVLREEIFESIFNPEDSHDLEVELFHDIFCQRYKLVERQHRLRLLLDHRLHVEQEVVNFLLENPLVILGKQLEYFEFVREARPHKPVHVSQVVD